MLKASLRILRIVSVLGVSANLSCTIETKGSCLTQCLKLCLTILDCLGFQFFLMEISCGGFPCQERHQNVVLPGGSPVKTE